MAIAPVRRNEVEEGLYAQTENVWKKGHEVLSEALEGDTKSTDNDNQEAKPKLDLSHGLTEELSNHILSKLLDSNAKVALHSPGFLLLVQYAFAHAMYISLPPEHALAHVLSAN